MKKARSAFHAIDCLLLVDTRCYVPFHICSSPFPCLLHSHRRTSRHRRRIAGLSSYTEETQSHFDRDPADALEGVFFPSTFPVKHTWVGVEARLASVVVVVVHIPAVEGLDTVGAGDLENSTDLLLSLVAADADAASTFVPWLEKDPGILRGGATKANVLLLPPFDREIILAVVVDGEEPLKEDSDHQGAEAVLLAMRGVECDCRIVGMVEVLRNNLLPEPEACGDRCRAALWVVDNGAEGGPDVALNCWMDRPPGVVAALVAC